MLYNNCKCCGQRCKYNAVVDRGIGEVTEVTLESVSNILFLFTSPMLAVFTWLSSFASSFPSQMPLLLVEEVGVEELGQTQIQTQILQHRSNLIRLAVSSAIYHYPASTSS